MGFQRPDLSVFSRYPHQTWVCHGYLWEMMGQASNRLLTDSCWQTLFLASLAQVIFYLLCYFQIMQRISGEIRRWEIWRCMRSH